MADLRMSDGELTVFANKLDAFGKELEPREQSLLKDILIRAATPSEDDVEGHHVIADPVLGMHLFHLGRALPWYELQHHIQGLILHIGRVHHIVPSPLPPAGRPQI